MLASCASTRARLSSKIIFWMIIVVFIFWGVGVMVAGGDKVNVAAMWTGADQRQAYAAPTSGWSASTASFTART